MERNRLSLLLVHTSQTQTARTLIRAEVDVVLGIEGVVFDAPVLSAQAMSRHKLVL